MTSRSLQRHHNSKKSNPPRCRPALPDNPYRPAPAEWPIMPTGSRTEPAWCQFHPARVRGGATDLWASLRPGRPYSLSRWLPRDGLPHIEFNGPARLPSGRGPRSPATRRVCAPARPGTHNGREFDASVSTDRIGQFRESADFGQVFLVQESERGVDRLPVLGDEIALDASHVLESEHIEAGSSNAPQPTQQCEDRAEPPASNRAVRPGTESPVFIPCSRPPCSSRPQDRTCSVPSGVRPGAARLRVPRTSRRSSCKPRCGVTLARACRTGRWSASTGWAGGLFRRR